MSTSALHLGRWARAAPPRARPTLVLDLDETTFWRPRGLLDAAVMYTQPRALIGTPYAGAIAAVRAASERFNVVAVTARWRVAERSTERMLAAAGLERVPTIFAAGVHPGDASRVAFKARAIRHLRDEGWAPFAGVGDRRSDLRAYAREGLAALMVAHAEGAAAGGAARALAELLPVEAELRERAGAAGAPPPRVVFFTDCPRAELAALAGLAAPLLFPGGDQCVWAQVADFLAREAPP
jgi:hypothetical protein